MKIEINNQFRQALDLMGNTRKNVFITGRAGTGKSTLLNYFRKSSRKKTAFLAPTGVAAINIEGQTIHSFFGFKPDITQQAIMKLKSYRADLYKEVEAIVIDEISMVRADLLDCVDKFMRLNGRESNKPFGGVQMVFMGDLYQLPPVVLGKEKHIFSKHYRSQYFFDAKAFENLNMEFIELEKIYRQTDSKFIELLNAIRNNSITEKELDIINKTVNPSFAINPNQFYIQLTPTNDLAYEINQIELSKIKNKLFEYKGIIKGKFDEKYLPTEIDLRVKTGSQIMLVNNDSWDRWVNGTVGKIVAMEQDKKNVTTIIVELKDGRKVDVKPYTWKISELYYNNETNNLDSKLIGSFTQYPLKLAWAVTIHKSQGKTFDNVVIDIGRGTFTHGQVYVALSRCTSLEGIVLRKPIQKKHIFMDWKVVNFLTKYQYRISEKNLSLNDKIKMIEKAIRNRSKLDIVYLKASDVKSQRVIAPLRVGNMEYLGRSYIGVEGYCLKRKDNRIFRVDRILEMKEVL